MSSSCSELRDRLKECIARSDCMVKHGLTAKECLQWKQEGVEPSCRKIEHAFFECKRGMVDQRNRFRGNKTT